MKSNHTILVDMDDTIEDLVEAWIMYLNNKYNYKVDPQSVEEWDIAWYYPTLSREQIIEPLNLRDFWEYVQPKKDAIYYLNKLKEEGYKIKIVTASHYASIKFKLEEVLFKYFPFISWDDVVITRDKSIIKGTCLIDDGIHNLIEFPYDRILYDTPHNRSIDEKLFKATRVHNWEEIYCLIESRYV